MKGYDVNSEKYQNLAKDLADVDKSIYDAANSTADLKKELIDLRFQPFKDAQEDLEEIIDNLNDIQDMMDSDIFLDDNGDFTKQGLANIVLTNKQMDAYKQQVADYRKELEKIQELYDNGNIDEDDYKERTQNAVDAINKAAKNLYSSQQDMLKIYEDRITKVNEALKDNIEKRKDALSAKKDYYDYDKTLKEKNKDINTLKAQIAALEGTTNAAAAARLAQLKADLKDKEDDLADTKYEHQLDMESKGYDDLSEKADDTLDKALQAVKSNSELQKSIIDNMLKDVQASYSDAYGEINKIIEKTGYKTSDIFDKIVSKAELTNKKVKEVTAGKEANDIDTSAVDAKRPDKSKIDKIIELLNKMSGTYNGATSEPSGAGSQQQKTQTVEQVQNQQKATSTSSSTKKQQSSISKADQVLKDKVIKNNLKEWYNALPKGKPSASEMNAPHHDFYRYFWKKNKYVRAKDFKQAAEMLGYTSLAKKSYSKWTTAEKNKVFKKIKSYGFSKGGVVKNLIPADYNQLLGKAIIHNGDTGLISARAGETVLTEEFTKQLRPTVQSMNEFNKVMTERDISTTVPKVQNQNISFNPQFNINVDSIDSDMDIKQLGKDLSDMLYVDFTKRMRKDLSKSTGRNR